MSYMVLDTNLRPVPGGVAPSRAKYLVERQHEAHYFTVPGVEPHPTHGTIIRHRAIQPDDNRGRDEDTPVSICNADGEYLGWAWWEHFRANRRFVYDAMEARPEKVPWSPKTGGWRAVVLRELLDADGRARMRECLCHLAYEGVIRRAANRDTLSSCVGTNTAVPEDIIRSTIRKSQADLTFADFRRAAWQLEALRPASDPDCRSLRAAIRGRN